MKKTKFILLLSFVMFSINYTYSQEANAYTLLENISYRATEALEDSYIAERCVLDIYYPENIENFPTIIYFHGGGLKYGNKYIPEYLKEKGIAVVTVNYRFFPKVATDKIMDDAAASVAWVYQNIAEYGGDESLVFLSGHSAGGYLASMLGLDKKYLKAYEIDANTLAGLIPFSGHAITHMAVREEQGIPMTKPLVDAMAPLYHVRADAPPYIIITGDRDQELLGRYEENAYMMRMMKLVGHEKTELYEIQAYGHDMVYPAVPILLRKVNEITKQLKEVGPEKVMDSIN